MRISPILALFGASLLTQANGKKAPEPKFFNGVEVPPLLDLTPATFKEEMASSKFLMVKYYSPYCPHCLDFAGTYETAYQFYHTSQPVGTDQSFREFYGYQWGSINCVAYYDLCSENNVTSYPTTVLYKDGAYHDKLKGAKNMTLLSNLIERALAEEKPGSRPAKLLLPQPGDSSSPKEADDSTSAVEDSAEEKSTVDEKPADVETAETAETIENENESRQQAMVADTETPEEVADAKTPEEVAVANTVPTQTNPRVDEAPVFPPPILVLPTRPKSTVTPNPDGVSVPLSLETFQNRVTVTQDVWFVKFYAPWCQHCKTLAPTWQQVASEMKGRLNVGEVNCDQEPRLCKDVRVQGYPTMIVFRGGERVEYDGLRGLGDFLDFAESASQLEDGIPEVNAASFRAMEEKEDVIFVYFYDHAAVSEDFMALERLPMSLLGRAKLVRTRDPELYARFKITSWPRLMVAREGRPTYYPPLAPKDMRDIPAILRWMKFTWLPIVPELTAANAREVMDGKIVVLGILNRDDQDAFASAQREMKSAANEWMDKQVQLFQLERQELRDAKQLRIEEAEDRNDNRALRQAKNIRIKMDMSDKKQVTFAWVDGVFWQRWIRTTYGIDVKNGDRVIINDEDNRRYWDTTVTGNNITPSRTSIMETISKVTASPPKIKPKLTISSFEKVFFDIWMTFIEHPWLSLGCVSGIALAALSWFRGRLRRTRPNFRLEDAMGGMKEIKDGLLGGGGSSTNGKVD